MILQALTRYYDILVKDGKSGIALPGYSTVGVSFALNISLQGELVDIFPLSTERRGQKTVVIPQPMTVPEQVNHTNKVSAFFLCDNSTYVLGISDRDDLAYGIKRFEAFRQFNKKLLARADCDAAKAVIAFLDGYDPRKGKEHHAIASNIESLLEGGRLVFMLRGNYVHEDAAIIKAWEFFNASSDAIFGQCLVSGEIAPIARLHPSLQGIRKANSTGAKLVSFNDQAYESYNRTDGQGLNSPVSEKAAFAYTKVLNHLLSDRNENKKFFIGDTTVVYWAESEKKEYANAFEGIFEPVIVDDESPTDADIQGEQKRAGERLGEIVRKVKRVQALDATRLTEGLDKNTRFYVLGLAPNVARVSVRFFFADPFEKVVERIMRHYSDLEIITNPREFYDQPKYITIQHILSETVSKKVKDQDAAPLMAGAMFRAILTNTPYPAALFYAVMNRIRADMDESKKNIYKINYVRAAVIKGFLIRKYRNQPQHPIQEVLSMSLNEQSTIPAYVLGRLFAVLEDLQIEAAKPTKLNATIKDRYFTSACASPASVFPVLLRLSQHHISKAEYGNASDRRIQDIMNLLDVEKNPIPARLTLDEQGIFVLGYYHQRAAFYVSKTDKSGMDTPSHESR